MNALLRYGREEMYAREAAMAQNQHEPILPPQDYINADVPPGIRYRFRVTFSTGGGATSTTVITLDMGAATSFLDLQLAIIQALRQFELRGRPGYQTTPRVSDVVGIPELISVERGA
jgi:hypothetical protein